MESKTTKSQKSLMLFQKEMLGILGFLLVPFAIGFGLLGDSNPATWWHSISMTYYANSNICMVGVLFSMSVLFFSYYGYDASDKILSFVAGAASLGVLVFPCGHDGLPCEEAVNEILGITECVRRTGILDLEIGLSFKIHCVCASVLFIDFAIMTGYNFTRSNPESMSDKKVLRNKIYKICSTIIVVFMLNQVVTSITDAPGWWTLINEFIMLLAFSFAWLVKAEFFNRFND